MPFSPSPACRAVLFDLGNVVIDIDFRRVLAAWQPASSLPPDALARAFGFDAPYEQHETGALTGEGYFAHLRQRLGLQASDDVLRQGWNAVFVQPIEETVDLIDQVAPVVPCYAFSNTNAIHLAEMQRAFPEVMARFRHVFASHEIGHRKPRPEAFRHVVDAMGVAPGEVLFFDDTPVNVEGARACGLQAVLVRSPRDVWQGLAQAELLPAP